MYVMITELLSGLALFLFGMKYMSDSLQQAAGEKLRGFLDKCTKNKYVGVLFGALFTAFIQSSGATTVMEVGFVNAGILTLEKSIGLTFGANIGTTITSQLVSLKLTAVAPFITFAGAAILMFGKKPLLKKIAAVIFGFGSLFLGINFMTGALKMVPEFPSLVRLFGYLGNPVIAVLVGLIITTILQSSSVTVSVLVLLAGSGLVEPLACLYFILGANIGSCAPAVMASMQANKNAKRTAFIHVMFNVVGLIVISIILIFASEPLINGIMGISGAGNFKRFVANADTIFKIFQCVILLPCTNQLVKLSKKVIRSNGEAEYEENKMFLKHIGMTTTPSISTVVVEVTQEIGRMAEMVGDNLEMAMTSLLNNDRTKAHDVFEREKYINFLNHSITEYMVKVSQYGIPLKDREQISKMFHVVIDLERIGDHAVNIMEDNMKDSVNKVNFSEDGLQEITAMYGDVKKIYKMSIDAFMTMNKSNLEDINRLENEIDQKTIDYQKSHVKRMAQQKCSIEAGVVFTDLIIGLERVADHAKNIAYSLE